MVALIDTCKWSICIKILHHYICLLHIFYMFNISKNPSLSWYRRKLFPCEGKKRVFVEENSMGYTNVPYNSSTHVNMKGVEPCQWKSVISQYRHPPCMERAQILLKWKVLFAKPVIASIRKGLSYYDQSYGGPIGSTGVFMGQAGLC